MKVSTAIQELSKLNPDEEIIVSWFDKQTYQDYYNDEQEVNPNDWNYLVNKIEQSDYYWQQINWTTEEAVESLKREKVSK